MWTVQNLIDDQMTVTAYCHNSACNRHQQLDLASLRERLGPDAPAMHDDLAPKLKCSRCGSKKLGLIYSPPAQGNANRYRSAKDGR